VVRGDALVVGVSSDGAPDELLVLRLTEKNPAWPGRRALPGCPKLHPVLAPGYAKSRGRALRWAYGDGFVWASCVCTSLNSGIDGSRINRVALLDNLELRSEFDYPSPPGAPRFDANPLILPPGTKFADLMFFQSQPGPQGDGGAGPCVAESCAPIRDLDRTPTGTDNYDIVPLGPTSFRVYGLAMPGHILSDFLPVVAKPTMFAIDYSFKEMPAPGGKMPLAAVPVAWDGTWSVAEAIDVEFTGRFNAIVAGADVYAVREVGRIYRKELEKGKARMRLADIPEQGKICALLKIADRKETYAFTDTVAFKLAGPLDGPRIPTTAAANPQDVDPWKVLRRCADALVELGIIKLPRNRERSEKASERSSESK
jgi:hypothetical protein